MASKGILTLGAASPALKMTSFTKSIFQKGVGSELLTSGTQILKTKLTMDHKVHWSWMTAYTYCMYLPRKIMKKTQMKIKTENCWCKIIFLCLLKICWSDWKLAVLGAFCNRKKEQKLCHLIIISMLFSLSPSIFWVRVCCSMVFFQCVVHKCLRSL